MKPLQYKTEATRDQTHGGVNKQHEKELYTQFNFRGESQGGIVDMVGTAQRRGVPQLRPRSSIFTDHDDTRGEGEVDYVIPIDISVL